MSNTTGTTEGTPLKKQKTDEGAEQIIVKLTNNKNDRSFYCTVKPTITFGKIFQTYCQHHNLEADTACFLYNDQKLLSNLTPADINFPDGGEIDVMAHVSGGGANSAKDLWIGFIILHT